MNQIIEEFLAFRKQFTKLQWQEINHLVDSRLNSKAAELQLDDQDIQKITNVLKRSSFNGQLKINPELNRNL